LGVELTEIGRYGLLHGGSLGRCGGGC
jgi:hypothetical protein